MEWSQRSGRGSIIDQMGSQQLDGDLDNLTGCEYQLHVPNGIKGQIRISKSSNGSAYMLASPLSVSQVCPRGN